MRFKLPRAVAVCALVYLSVVALAAGISISTGTPYQESFDSLGTSSVASLPANFKVDRTTTVGPHSGQFRGGRELDDGGGRSEPVVDCL